MTLEIIDNGLHPAASGNTRPLLFIHGAGCGAWVWHNMLEWFASAGIPASAISLRGHGRSEGLERLHQFVIMDYVDDVATVIDAMDSLPVLVGHSMGGLVVQKLLESRNFPGAILLASTPVNGMLRDGLRMLLRWPVQVSKALLQRSLTALYVTEECAQWLLFHGMTDRSLVNQVRNRIGEESWRAILDMAIRVRPHPTRVSTPVLVLAGSDDHMVAVSSNIRTAHAYSAEIQFIDDCGHMMMLERAWPLVAKAINDWTELASRRQ
jgi:pimeloyl-ACP methyl ester carboxylesterase